MTTKFEDSRISNRGFVYFVRAGDAIKIGFSFEPEIRIATLQTSQHYDLEVLAIVPADIIAEHEAHKQFEHLRIRGEWFRNDDELLRFIATVSDENNETRILHQPIKTMSPEQRQLMGIRKRYGADTPKGHAISNAMQILETLKDPDYERPAWATHKTQSLHWELKRQLDVISN